MLSQLELSEQRSCQLVHEHEHAETICVRRELVCGLRKSETEASGSEKTGIKL